jgi:hypothetical protein
MNTGKQVEPQRHEENPEAVLRAQSFPLEYRLGVMQGLKQPRLITGLLMPCDSMDYH